MSNLPKEIHNNTAVSGIVFEQTTFRDWCASNGLEPDRLNGVRLLPRSVRPLPQGRLRDPQKGLHQ